MKSTKTHVSDPTYDMRILPKDFRRRLNSRSETIYLTARMIPRFTERYLKRIRKPFVLVSGNGDSPVNDKVIPESVLLRLLDSPYLTKWYAQNLDYEHAKLECLPIGVDYTTLAADVISLQNSRLGPRQTPVEQEERLLEIARASAPLSERRKQAFSNWHFALDRGNREECKAEFPEQRCFYQPEFMDREASWSLNSQFAFTLSPHGKGLDCYRTWEALLLGTIPIVKTSSLDALYRDLPVVVLKSWSDFTAGRLEEEYSKVLSTKYDFRKLTLNYWVDLIGGKSLAPAHFITFEDFLDSLRLSCG